MPLPEYFEFHDRTKVVYGVDSLNQVGSEAQQLGGTKAVLITDSIIRKLGFPERVKSALEDAGVEVALIRDDVPQDSDVRLINNIYEEAREAGVDICVGIGGGSVLDTTKMVNLLLTEGGDLLNDHQGAYLQERPLKPMIAVPTTAGTGSEVTFAAVVKDHESHQKVSFVSHFFAPNVAILDPVTNVSMPKSVTAATGMDALTHAVESLHSTESTPITDALSTGAISMISTNLPEAVLNGENLEARGRMLIAACIAGLAFSNSLVGIVHGIAHSIGGVAGVPHGVANSIMLPWCMEWNLDFCPEKYAMSAWAMGVVPTGDARADAVSGIARVRELIARTGLPVKLGAAGVKESHLEAIADLTMGDGTIVTNPRPVEDPAEVMELLKLAF